MAGGRAAAHARTPGPAHPATDGQHDAEPIADRSRRWRRYGLGDVGLSTCTVFAAGKAPLVLYEKDNDVGETVGGSTMFSVTVKVTGTVTFVPPAVTTTSPSYVPGVNNVALAVTTTSAGAIPVEGRARSQPPFQTAW